MLSIRKSGYLYAAPESRRRLNFYFYLLTSRSTIIVSMNKNIIYHNGWLKKGKIPVKYSQPMAPGCREKRKDKGKGKWIYIAQFL